MSSSECRSFVVSALSADPGDPSSDIPPGARLEVDVRRERRSADIRCLCNDPNALLNALGRADGTRGRAPGPERDRGGAAQKARAKERRTLPGSRPVRARDNGAARVCRGRQGGPGSSTSGKQSKNTFLNSAGHLEPVCP
jgi:hypothetical protein